MKIKLKAKKEHMNGFKDLNENRRLYAEQVKQLYKHTPIGVATTLVNSLILSFILWKVIPHAILIIWLAACVSAAAFRYLLFFKFYRSSPIPAKPSNWGIWFIISLSFSCTVWGSAGIFLFPINSIAHQVVISFVLGGMVAGAAGTFSIPLRAFISYSLPALLPIIIRFFVIGGPLQLAIGGHVAAFRIFDVCDCKTHKRRYPVFLAIAV